MTNTPSDTTEYAPLQKPRLIVLQEHSFPIGQIQGFQNKKRALSYLLLDKQQTRAYIHYLRMTPKEEYALHSTAMRSRLPESLTHEERVERLEEFFEYDSDENSVDNALAQIYSCPFFVLH